MYLTKRQRQMLECIETFIEENGYSPTLEEIGKMMGLSSPATVHKHLQNLEEKNLVRRRHNHSRALELVSEDEQGAEAFSLPLVGTVAAGVPIEAIEDIETVDVPQELVGTKDAFVLRVQGHSMIEDGIHDGDYIVVEKKETANRGQTVVAMIDGEHATVKRYDPRSAKEIRLIPANAAMETMVYSQDRVTIKGVVIGLMRKYAN